MGNICYIPLKGGIAVCDTGDYEVVSNVDGEWYICNGYPMVNKKGVKISIMRKIYKESASERGAFLIANFGNVVTGLPLPVNFIYLR